MFSGRLFSVRGLLRLLTQALVMMLITAGLLAAMEVALRLKGYGFSTRFLVEQSFEGVDYDVTNGNFFQQFFALPIDTMWQDAETFVPREKPKDTKRVVILGESAALGVPPDFAFSFGRILDCMLRTRFPETKFDVYVFAQPGVNSYAMREVARACRRIQPDFVVVYMGNNEINGPFGAVTVGRLSFLRSLPVIRAQILLRDLRLLQLVTGHGRVPWHAPTEGGDQVARLDDPRLGRSYHHFASNLRDIVRAARARGAEVLLCTVGCNQRTWRPGFSVNRPDLSPEDLQQWQARYAAGNAFEEQSQWAEAAREYEAAAAIDDTHAELQFRLGQCGLRLGRKESAAARLRSACELDGFRARTLPRMNELTKAEAAGRADNAVQFIDTAQTLALESPDGIPGPEFFCDNVHLTFPGNYVIAREIFKTLVATLPEDITAQANGNLAPLERAECEERLGLTPGVLLKHLKGVVLAYRMWWKVPTPELDQQITELEAKLGADVLSGIAEGYRRALAFYEDDRLLRTRYAETLLEMGSVPEAAEQARTLVQRYPYRPATHRFLGTILAREGKNDEALRELDEAQRLFSEDARTQFQRGQLLEKLARPADAKAAYIEAILLNPRNFEPYDPLNAIFNQENGVSGRTEGWAALVKQVPDSARAHFHLGMACEAAEDFDRAIEQYREACRLEQFDAAMQGALGRALLRQKDYIGAIPFLINVVRINPDIADLRPLLVDAFIKAGNLDEARAEAARCKERGIEVPAEVTEALNEPSTAQ